MKDLLITINANSRDVKFTRNFVGVNGEYLDGYIKVDFEDEFIDGTATFEIERSDGKYYIEMQKGNDDYYYLQIKSSLLSKAEKLKCQIRVDQASEEVFKCRRFPLYVLTAVNSTATIPEDYGDWMSHANQKLLEIDDAIEDTETATERANTISADLENKRDTDYYRGETGNGIASIVKTSTSGLVDTYTVTMTNGETATFTVTNGAKGDTGATGNGIQSITKTGTAGLVDTYTVLFTDGTSTTFTITNGAKGDKGETGNGILSIVKTSTSGLVDTYTITFTDGTTTTFTVTNGQDGTGTEIYVNGVGVSSVNFTSDPQQQITANATAIENNTNNIATNTNNIATNTQNISALNANIIANSNNIAVNVANISNNLNLIRANSAKIETNENNIATNAQNIATNAQNISANATAIENNAQNIAYNTTRVTQNASNIATNTANIAENSENIEATATAVNKINEKVPYLHTENAIINPNWLVNTSGLTSFSATGEEIAFVDGWKMGSETGTVSHTYGSNRIYLCPTGYVKQDLFVDQSPRLMRNALAGKKMYFTVCLTGVIPEGVKFYVEYSTRTQQNRKKELDVSGTSGSTTHTIYYSVPSAIQSLGIKIINTGSADTDFYVLWAKAEISNGYTNYFSPKFTILEQLKGRELVNTISSSSTDNEIPTAKAVYDFSGGGGGSSGTTLYMHTIEANMQNSQNSFIIRGYIIGNFSTQLTAEYLSYILQGEQIAGFNFINREIQISVLVGSYYSPCKVFSVEQDEYYNDLDIILFDNPSTTFTALKYYSCSINTVTDVVTTL